MMGYYQIHGRNGASFFLSLNSFSDWRRSLEFYRGVSAAAKCKKALLTAAYPLFRFRGNFNGSEFEYGKLDASDSAMISPTRDKVIIHHHGRGYEKIAFGKSLPGVRGELEVYRRLNENPPESFAVSRVEELKSSPEQCRFFMNYAGGVFSENVPGIEDLLLPLKEFFRLGPGGKRTWKSLWETLPDDLRKLVPADDHEGETEAGLVHRDFKPWNVKAGAKPLFFDFEAASLDGCPLEDFFNYTVDSMLRLKTPEYVSARIRDLFSMAEKLLKMQNISGDVRRYCRWFLLERTAFWRGQGQPQLSAKFKELFLLTER